MGCCCAPNCSNSSRNGRRLFRFPKDAARRKRWVINCRWKNWKPTSCSQLCEDHFEESQYELKRQDGRKLLKWSAIPTIFNVANAPKLIEPKRKPPKARAAIEKKKTTPTTTPTANPTTSPTNERQKQTNDEADVSQDDHASEIQETMTHQSPPNKRLKLRKEQPDASQGLQPTNDTYVCLIAQEKLPIIGSEVGAFTELKLLKKENEYLKYRIKYLEKREAHLTANLDKFLHEDQREFLKCGGPNSRMPWSEETLNDALEIRTAAGRKAYELLREKGYPLPHQATLNRHVRYVDIALGIGVSIIKKITGVGGAHQLDHSYDSVAVDTSPGIDLGESFLEITVDGAHEPHSAGESVVTASIMA